MNDEKNISGLIHHLSRQLVTASNSKWTAIGYPDIRTTHVSILIRVEKAENNHNILAKQLGLSRQAVSRLKHELIDNGYLCIAADPHNKNAELLSLTEKGGRFMADFKKANHELEKSFIKIVGKDRFAEFKSALLTLDTYFKAK